MASPAPLKMEANKQAAEIKSGFFASPENRTVVLSLLLALLTLITYNPVSRNDFVSFDDPEYITTNLHVRAGLTWNTVKWAFTSAEHANWHPLTWLSHALDWQLFHQNPAGHHYMNVLLHALTAVLLFLFLQGATGFAWRSAAVAALFAIHPINVESVAWASERKNVLSLLFFVLMLLAYRWYAQRPGWKRYGLVALLFALGLMSKPILVTAPFLLLLLDYWPLERTKTNSSARLILEKLPLLALSIASSIITVVAQKNSGAIHSAGFTLANRASNGIVSYVRYMGKLLWPSHLAAFYPHPAHVPAWQWGISVAILLAASILTFVRRDRRYLAAGWLWFLGAMVPMIGIVQAGEQAMSDRYAYLPAIGLFVALVWGVADWARARRIPAHYLGIAACAAVVALSAVTHYQIGYWKDTKTLWTHAVAVTGPNFVAEDSLGAELIYEGNLTEAAGHLRKAVAINPRDPFSRLDLGVCEKRSGDVVQAIADYQAALQLATDRGLRTTAFGNLGSIYRMRGDYAQAQANYQAALQLMPDYALALTGMGLIAEKNADPRTAANYFSRAASAAPSDLEYLLLSGAFAKAGEQQAANQSMAKAQGMSQNWDATVAEVKHLLSE